MGNLKYRAEMINDVEAAIFLFGNRKVDNFCIFLYAKLNIIWKIFTKM